MYRNKVFENVTVKLYNYLTLCIHLKIKCTHITLNTNILYDFIFDIYILSSDNSHHVFFNFKFL